MHIILFAAASLWITTALIQPQRITSTISLFNSKYQWKELENYIYQEGIKQASKKQKKKQGSNKLRRGDYVIQRGNEWWSGGSWASPGEPQPPSCAPLTSSSLLSPSLSLYQCKSRPTRALLSPDVYRLPNGSKRDREVWVWRAWMEDQERIPISI